MTSDIDIVIAEQEEQSLGEQIEQPTELPENIAETLSEDQLEEISNTVYREYEIDETNFKSRKQRIEELYKLALQVAEQKTYPWANASNIKYPLITDAALAFSAIAYPSIVKDDKVVKGDSEIAKCGRFVKIAHFLFWGTSHLLCCPCPYPIRFFSDPGVFSA